MSGIVGIINLDGAPVDRELLGRMTDFMSFRGPDAQEIWIDGNVGFGHTMLRTTFEAETEKQPLTLDGRVWLTADARIDGRAELIAESEGKLRRKLLVPVPANGHGTNSRIPNDAELILFAYEAWSEDCVKHLIGDFAFAIWDGRARNLFCARDHFGVKPFYYAHVGDTFCFSNTLNCIRQHPAISNRLDEVAIGDYLLFGNNCEPNKTAFADIARLLQASCLSVSRGSVRMRKYWSVATDFHLHYKDSRDYPEQFRALLSQSVKDRLRSDRVAIEMSGGLDSTSIAALAAQMTANKAAVMKAFCVSYEHLIPDQEGQYADIAASAIGLPIEHLIGDEFPLFDDVAKPEPFDIYPLSTISTELIRRMSLHGRVILTGWDGDTWINETPRHYFSFLFKRGQLGDLAAAMGCYIRSQRKFPPVGARTALKRWRGKAPSPLYPDWLEPGFERRGELRERWKQQTAEPQSAHPTRPSVFTISSSPGWARLFESYDAGVTGIPVEARHPISDMRVVEFLLRLPPVPWCVNKEIVRNAMRGILPREILYRPKTPLAGNPEVKIIERRPPDEIDCFVQKPELNVYINRDAVPRVTAERDTWRLWLNSRPFSFNQWLDRYLEITNVRVIGKSLELAVSENANLRT